jgi:hypothetical protein
LVAVFKAVAAKYNTSPDPSREDFQHRPTAANFLLLDYSLLLFPLDFCSCLLP